MFQNKPARKAALGLALACAMAGCAPLASAQHEAGDVTQKALLEFNSCAKPMYPESDLRERHQGTVALDFKVGQDGKVTASKVQRSSGFAGLDEAARVALEKCSLKPALKDGRPVEAWTLVQYVWTLE